MSSILVLYYSMYGHIERMAKAVVEGARSVEDTQVILKRVPELMSEEAARKAGAKLNQDSPIARVEMAVDGKLEWRPLAAADGILDTADERIDSDPVRTLR